MRLDPDCFPRRMLFDFDCLPAFFADQNLIAEFSGLHLHLFEFLHGIFNISCCFFFIQIVVKYLVVPVFFALVQNIVFMLHRADLNLYNSAFFTWIADYC